MELNYKFLCIDEGKQKLHCGESGSKTIFWSLPLKDYPTARAMQKISQDRVLIGFDKGYIEINPENGDVLHSCSRWKKVTSAYRKKDGTTLITGLNLEGMDGISVLSLNEKDELVEKVSCPGDYVRLMTVHGDEFALSANDKVSICDEKLNLKREMAADGFLHAWQSHFFEDGSSLVSAGYGAFMARFSAEGELVQTFGRKGELPRKVKPNFYASIRIAPDGNILVANWQGHGPWNGLKGRQLICFSPEGEYLDSWSFPRFISSFQGLLLL